MKISENEEVFYKVGRSINITRRVKELSKFYSTIEVVWYSSRFIWSGVERLEYFFHKDFKNKSYKPLKYFAGCSECYTYLNPAVMRNYLKTNKHMITISPYGKGKIEGVNLLWL